MTNRTTSGRASTAGQRPARVRPERTRGTLATCALTLALWAAVAHASGSEWVQAIGTVVAGVVVVGFLAPLFATRRVEVTVLSAPRDATAGQAVTLAVVASRPCRLTPLRPGGTTLSLARNRPGELVISPEHRGVLGAVSVRLSSAAPLGLFWWAGCSRLRLPAPLTIAPAPVDRFQAARVSTAEGEHGVVGLQAEFGELRGVREYRLGDSPRRIHWRASAHTGELMVRESELRSDLPVHLVADLPDDVEVAESAASEALGTVRTWLERHRRVILETIDGGEPVVAEVHDLKEAGRRLGQAGVNPWRDLAPASPQVASARTFAGAGAEAAV